MDICWNSQCCEGQKAKLHCFLYKTHGAFSWMIWVCLCMESCSHVVFGFGQAWNTQTATDLSLSGPTGQVYALVVGNEMLFAGIQVNHASYKWRCVVFLEISINGGSYMFILVCRTVTYSPGSLVLWAIALNLQLLLAAIDLVLFLSLLEQ